MSPSPAAYPSVLSIGGLKARVRLGVGEEERAGAQDVFIDIRFYQPEPPAAASSDEAEYLCYYTVSEKIRALCSAKEYRLIEYLTHDIYRLLRGLVPAEVKIGVLLRKPRIMLPYVEEGASYSFTDLPAGAWVGA